MKNFQITRTALLVTMTLMSVPAFSQIDLAGNWDRRLHQDWEERDPGPEAVDYLGMPINGEARTVALSYMASQLTLPERQCLYYPPYYVVLGPQGLKIWAESDPVAGTTVAWKISAAIDRDALTIWMDGRPHPPKDAPHTFAGFTTGVWEGNVLTTYTTHMKAGYLRRNGVPSSDETTVTIHFMRHGDTLTLSAHIDDPVYLTAPYVISRSWQLDPTVAISPTPSPCTPAVEVAQLQGVGVPHYLPGKNPFVDELTKFYHIPVDAVMGGAETMYPEYRKQLKANDVAPEKCVRYCCGWEERAGPGKLNCIGRGFASAAEPNGRQ